MAQSPLARTGQPRRRERESHLKHAGDKRRKVDNLEVQLREDLADQAGVLRPAAPKAPKQSVVKRDQKTFLRFGVLVDLVQECVVVVTDYQATQVDILIEKLL